MTRPTVVATRAQEAVRIRSDICCSSLARCSVTQRSRDCCAPQTTCRPPTWRNNVTKLAGVQRQLPRTSDSPRPGALAANSSPRRPWHAEPANICSASALLRGHSCEQSAQRFAAASAGSFKRCTEVVALTEISSVAVIVKSSACPQTQLRSGMQPQTARRSCAARGNSFMLRVCPNCQKIRLS